ncbi:unnamed protein product [Rhodiola kirilowii]
MFTLVALRNPSAYITNVKTKLGVKHVPSKASSLRELINAIEVEILKPDVTAPGVAVIAAYRGPNGDPSTFCPKYPCFAHTFPVSSVCSIHPD